MSDYEKLTVVKLREELVKRRLPKTGLKAALVQRLVEADGQFHDTGAKENSEIEESTKDGTEPAPSATAIDSRADTQPETSEDADSAVPLPSKQSDTETIHSGLLNNDGVLAAESRTTTNGVARPESRADEAVTKASEVASVISKTSYLEATAQLDGVSDPKDDNAGEMDTQEIPPAAIPSEIQQPIIDRPSINSTETSLREGESSEDTRKRKRRSLTPPPSSAEVAQKKAKAGDGRPYVKLPEDTSMGEATPSIANGPETNQSGPLQKSGDEGSIVGIAENVAPPGDSRLNHESLPEAEVSGARPLQQKISKDPDKPVAESQDHPSPKAADAAAPEKTAQPLKVSLNSPSKPAPSDTRFKNLISPTSKRDSPPSRQAVKVDTEDRTVSPALHPATSALYIREFMRPLHVGNLKEHLIALATPPNDSPDPEIIAEFFLDSIRTHCLIKFVNVAAASRVRTQLHDRVWPDEKNRKALWVDFVPEEKLQKWFEVEEHSSGRGQAAKRWEVVYENEEDGVKAYLQEVGSNSGGLRLTQAPLARAESGMGVLGAPSGPRVKERARPGSHPGPQPDSGKGFKALDDLFKSTTAKPKLYYLPVPERTVNRRLDILSEGRGGGRSNEMRRYTFEEGVLVDRGPEFGSRGRGGYGGRGGGSHGGYSGRGGGTRGDYRVDRGDYRGDFRGEYRRDRR